MYRVGALVAALAIAATADYLGERHVREITSLVESGAHHSSVLAYERREPPHSFHLGEEYFLLAMMGVAAACSSTTLSRWELFRASWGVGLGTVIVCAGLSVVFAMVTDGAELQFGAHMPFLKSTRPIIFLDGAVVIISATLLFTGPPRGWSGVEDL